MICVPITAATNDDAKRSLAQAAAVADIAEVRFDYVSQPDVGQVLV